MRDTKLLDKLFQFLLIFVNFGHSEIVVVVLLKGDSKVALTRPKDVSREIEIILA